MRKDGDIKGRENVGDFKKGDNDRKIENRREREKKREMIGQKR